jgi:hypothetical protein
MRGRQKRKPPSAPRWNRCLSITACLIGTTKLDRREAGNALVKLVAENALHLCSNVAVNCMMAELTKDDEGFKQHTMDMLGTYLGREISDRIPAKVEKRPFMFSHPNGPMEEVHTLDVVVFSREQWNTFKEGVIQLLQQK